MHKLENPADIVSHLYDVTLIEKKGFLEVLRKFKLSNILIRVNKIISKRIVGRAKLISKESQNLLEYTENSAKSSIGLMHADQ